MSDSLSVLLPVHNAPKSLVRLAAGLLEVLPDLTARFEILVLDDASSDATSEAAHELAARFPQLRVVRNPTRLGRAGLPRIGLAQTRGEQLLVCDEGCQLEVRDLHKLWRSRRDFDAVLAWPADASRPSDEIWSQRVRAWRMRISQQRPAAAQSPGYQLLRRPTLELLRSLPADRYELLTELTRLGQTWQVVEVRTSRDLAEPMMLHPGQSVRVDGSQQHARPASALKSKQLDKLRDFALGE